LKISIGPKPKREEGSYQKKKKRKEEKLDAGIHIAKRTLFWKGRDSNYVYSIAPVLSSLFYHRRKRMMG